MHIYVYIWEQCFLFANMLSILATVLVTMITTLELSFQLPFLITLPTSLNYILYVNNIHQLEKRRKKKNLSTYMCGRIKQEINTIYYACLILYRMVEIQKSVKFSNWSHKNKMKNWRKIKLFNICKWYVDWENSRIFPVLMYKCS